MPEKFDLLAIDSVDTDSPGETPDLVAAYLRRQYGFAQVFAKDWFEYRCVMFGGGVEVVFDAHETPHALGWLRALEIAADILKTDYGRAIVSRDEAGELVRNWHTPHETATEILRKRRLNGEAEDVPYVEDAE